MIVCIKCRAVLAITFHPLLKAADEARISKVYQEKLCTAHKVTCPFHSNAFPSSSLHKTIVPSYLGSVLPQESVALFEQSNSKVLLEKQVKLLLNAVGEGREPVPLDLSTKQLEEILQEGETIESFVARIANALCCTDNDWAAVLALFCWKPMDIRQPSEHVNQVVLLQCPVCLAQRALNLQMDESDDSSVDDLRPAKKPRIAAGEKMNPISSHRHYCPIICGFPCQGSSAPMWQTIATNLLRAGRSQEDVNELKGEEVMMNIHRLLQSGLR